MYKQQRNLEMSYTRSIHKHTVVLYIWWPLASRHIYWFAAFQWLVQREALLCGLPSGHVHCAVYTKVLPVHKAQNANAGTTHLEPFYTLYSMHACTHVCMIMSYTPANKIARPTTHHQRERIKDVSIVAWLQFVLVMLVWCYSSTCTPQLYGILPEQQPSSLCHLRWFGRQFCWVEWWCTSSSAGPSATGTSLSPLCPQLHCTAAEVHRW